MEDAPLDTRAGLLLAAVKGGEDGRPSLLQEEGAFSKVRMGREGAMAGRREERKKGAISINRERRRSRAAPRGRRDCCLYVGGEEVGWGRRGAAGGGV
jgi:hypothetical protein